MVRKHIAALAALTLISTPCAAFDSPSQQSPGVMFYFSVPLDARQPKEQTLSAGLLIQGKRQYETVKVDSRMFNFIGGGIEAKWIIAGVVAAGAVAAVATKDKSTTNTQQQQQTNAELASTSTGGSTGGGGTGSGTTCPKTPACP